MPFLDDATRGQLAAEFSKFENPVTLHLFTQELECQYCRETRQIVEELSALAPEWVKLQVHNFVIDKSAVDTYKIERIPAIAVVGQQDYGIRFYGVPAGYEFTSLFLAMKMVAHGQTELSAVSIAKLLKIQEPVKLQVFVTLTCPYCPSAVHLAHQMAMANPWITAEMIEAAEFPHLANREQVMGVPKTVVAGKGAFEGALPEPLYVDKVMELVGGGLL
jgi:glutaredoxin-like protein